METAFLGIGTNADITKKHEVIKRYAYTLGT